MKTLKGEARDLGFDLVGVCDASPPKTLAFYRQWIEAGRHAEMGYLARSVEIRADPARLLPGARSAIVVGLNYNQPNPPRPGGPSIARYALGRDYHKVLRAKLRALVRRMQPDHPGSLWRVCVDSAPLLEREFANRAGLGWFGKNTCLIDSRRGSWFVIGVALTTAELPPDQPALGGCGTCRACIDACPTGAIVLADGRWQVDARRCISYLTIEHRGPFDADQAAAIGNWTFGCDVCQEVCPFNRPRSSQPLRGAEAAEPGFLERREWPSLAELAVLSVERWDALTRGSAVRRAGWEGLARNARANLENAATGGPEET